MMEKKQRVKTSAPRSDLKWRQGSHGKTLKLRSKQIKPQTDHPSPGVLYEGDKPPCILKEPLEQTEGLERPRLHSQRMRGCWLADKRWTEFCTGGCSLAELLNPSMANTWPHSHHHPPNLSPGPRICANTAKGIDSSVYRDSLGAWGVVQVEQW